MLSADCMLLGSSKHLTEEMLSRRQLLVLGKLFSHQISRVLSLGHSRYQRCSSKQSNPAAAGGTCVLATRCKQESQDLVIWSTHPPQLRPGSRMSPFVNASVGPAIWFITKGTLDCFPRWSRFRFSILPILLLLSFLLVFGLSKPGYPKLSSSHWAPSIFPSHSVRVFKKLLLILWQKQGHLGLHLGLVQFWWFLQNNLEWSVQVPWISVYFLI